MRESDIMLTVNADVDLLMSRMHKPYPELAPDKQHKRSAVLRVLGDCAQWFERLSSTKALVRLACGGPSG